MSNSLTESVARLHRAGSENSQQTEKLRQAANDLLIWIRDNVETKPLPCNCTLYPSGEFTHEALDDNSGSMRVVLLMTIGINHDRYQLHLFSELIAEGFLEELALLLEEETHKFKKTSHKVEKFLTKK
jgi:hypothetical protein